MNNTISFQMMGGLGNILFPFATSYAISKRFDLDLKLFYHHTGYIHTHPLTYKDNLFKNVDTIKDINNFHIINQNKFEFYNLEIPKNKNIFLNGYFQSEKNFIEYKKELLDILCPDKNLIHDLINKYPNIQDDKTVSIHIRKGNYKNLQEFHPLLPNEYYYKALENFKEHKIFIFSDELEDCYHIFKKYECIFVKNNFDLHDMYLMSLCKNNIIANSTFSWWGAWLNKNKNKKIIAPKLWFGKNSCYNSKDIIPEDWITI